MSVGRSALLTYNAALNKTAYQSSKHSSCGASLASDGSRETSLWKGGTCRCSHTNRERNPWWAVDLGRPTTIYRVDLTNRGNRAGMRCFVLSFSVFSYGSLILFSLYSSLNSV